MSFEYPNTVENTPQPKIEVEAGFEKFVPNEFSTDPFCYFETHGRNIKSGEVEHDEEGLVKEDPTATKDLPVWKDLSGKELRVVGKKVNTVKSQVGKSGDPFYEYSIMEIAKEFDLPAPTPIAKAEHDDQHLIVMENVEGIRWTDEGMKPIHEANLTEEEKKVMLTQAQELMDNLQERFDAIGLVRKWKLKDMIFDVDIPNRKVLGITPTDWERTKIDSDILTRARAERGL